MIKPVPEDHWERKRRNADGTLVPPVRRAAWAPELHWVADNCFLTFTLNWVPNFATVLLKSTTGKAEGPYAHVSNGPMTSRIDSTLFEDVDGTVYFIWQDGQYAPLKPDFSGLAAPAKRLLQTQWQPEPYLEGVGVFRQGDRYYLTLAAWEYRAPDSMTATYSLSPEQRKSMVPWDYNCVIASSSRFEGPYGTRRTALVGGGHNSFFQTAFGDWYAT